MSQDVFHKSSSEVTGGKGVSTFKVTKKKARHLYKGKFQQQHNFHGSKFSEQHGNVPEFTFSPLNR